MEAILVGSLTGVAGLYLLRMDTKDAVICALGTSLGWWFLNPTKSEGAFEPLHDRLADRLEHIGEKTLASVIDQISKTEDDSDE